MLAKPRIELLEGNCRAIVTRGEPAAYEELPLIPRASGAHGGNGPQLPGIEYESTFLTLFALVGFNLELDHQQSAVRASYQIR
jgi:hypothetical protein